jgi:probable rRNA maturation factor
VYRGVDKKTDVLSFSLVAPQDASCDRRRAGTPLLLGDIVLAYPYARRQAAELGHPVALELAWLTIHGTLQLLGYAHDLQEEAEHMERIERRALDELGFRVEERTGALP